MRNLKRKGALTMMITLLLTTIFGVLRPMEAKAWTNLRTGQFNTPYTYDSEFEGIVTYEVDVPNSGVINQIMDVSEHSLSVRIYDASGTEIYYGSYSSDNTYTNYFWLIGGKYFIQFMNNNFRAAASFKWTFSSAEESFNENQYDRNNDFGTPFPIQLGSSINGQFAENDYKDIYSFSTEKRGALTLNIKEFHQSGLDISVVNEDGSYNYTEKDIPKGKKNITLQIPEGDYYIVCSGDSVGRYSFKTTFTKAPAGVKLSSAKNLKGGKLKATWKKGKAVDGYEVEISTSRNFDNNVTSRLVKGGKKTFFTFKNLSVSNYWSSYTYYCRVRAYKEKNKIKAFSDWSEEREVVMKK